MANILVAEDEPGIRSFIIEALEMDGHTVVGAADGLEAMMRLKQDRFDVLLTDLRMPGADGMTVFRSGRQLQPHLQVIILTAFGTVETAVDAMKEGAFDYLQKPIGSLAELRSLAKRAAVASQKPAAPPQNSPASSSSSDGSLRLTWGASSMEPVVKGLRKVAPTRATVLLLGESGCGKEVAAQALHQWSPRASKPFVAVNCAVLSENLLESELFGHEKGAFTGALQRKQGRIELAHEGTFFLDEVGELKLELQSKLLRVLEEKYFERLGGSQRIDVDVRWVAATN
ncbi:MAG: sigma-54 dependent transcriptional regulator, partial [Myxococcota bacterium]